MRLSVFKLELKQYLNQQGSCQTISLFVDTRKEVIFQGLTTWVVPMKVFQNADPVKFKVSCKILKNLCENDKKETVLFNFDDGDVNGLPCLVIF